MTEMYDSGPINDTRLLNPQPPRPDDPARLVELKTQEEKLTSTIAEQVQVAMQAGQLTPVSFSLLEIQTRMEVLFDSLFGEDTVDRHSFEVAVRHAFLAKLRALMPQVAAHREQQASQARRSALLEGVTMRAGRPPGGRTGL